MISRSSHGTLFEWTPCGCDEGHLEEHLKGTKFGSVTSSTEPGHGFWHSWMLYLRLWSTVVGWPGRYGALVTSPRCLPVSTAKFLEASLQSKFRNRKGTFLSTAAPCARRLGARQVSQWGQTNSGLTDSLAMMWGQSAATLREGVHSTLYWNLFGCMPVLWQFLHIVFAAFVARECVMH